MEVYEVGGGGTGGLADGNGAVTAFLLLLLVAVQLTLVDKFTGPCHAVPHLVNLLNLLPQPPTLSGRKQQQLP